MRRPTRQRIHGARRLTPTRKENTTKTKFELGRILITPTLQPHITPEVLAALRRHAHGDWGDLDDEDKAANDAALTNGSRLYSSYKGVADGRDVTIITEAIVEDDGYEQAGYVKGHRPCTTLMFPEDY